jgi:lipoyl synthase
MESQSTLPFEQAAEGGGAGLRGSDTTSDLGPKPAWLKKRLPRAAPLRSMEGLLRGQGLRTVCENARCPNKGECFERGTATFLILGDVCTRDCRFCAVSSGRPGPLDPAETEEVAAAAAALGLRHVVVTSVTRDDLPDGGSGHFAATIRALRHRLPGEATVEVLVPDFLGSRAALDTVLTEAPDVFNHNVETVPRLYPQVRPQADYRRSLDVLGHAAHAGVVVKSGAMVGLGESAEEVRQVMRDLQAVGVRMLTLGQYLRPSPRHLPVVEYVSPDAFAEYRAAGEQLGLVVEAAPFVRSSYRAEESLRRLRERRHDGRESTC